MIIPNKRPIMTISHAKFACVLLLGSMLAATAAQALGQQVGREEDGPEPASGVVDRDVVSGLCLAAA